MLLSTVARKLVLNLREPDRVLTIIPTAKTFEYKGSTLVAVPHKEDEVKVLRNLGFAAPAPIEHYYEWPGQYKPFHAQRTTSSFLTQNDKAFVLNDMGTGKTLATLWAFDYLRSIGKAKKLLVISPLSTLERTWADEIFGHFPHLSAGIAHGPKARRQKILADDYDVILTNHDGVKTIEEELIARDDIDTVVIDEIAAFRNVSTARWKSLKKVCAGRERIWGLTGTPIPNSPADAFGQCRIISPDRVPLYFGKFRDTVMKQNGPFKWVPRPGSTEIVAEAMQPSIRFSRDECVDLPPCQFVERVVPMTPEQAKAFKDMAAQLRMEFGGDEASAVNEAVKIQKLVQIACGVVYGTDGEDIILPNTHRIDVVRETIEEAGTKTIVFVPFKGVLYHVAAQLAEHFTVETISGDTSSAKRAEVFGNFQKAKDPQVIVAQPAAMSHGLTLTAASTVVWYAPINSAEIYTQANARITRPGQKHSQLIVNISASEVERKIYQRLKAKQSLQGILLDSI